MCLERLFAFAVGEVTPLLCSISQLPRKTALVCGLTTKTRHWTGHSPGLKPVCFSTYLFQHRRRFYYKASLEPSIMLCCLSTHCSYYEIGTCRAEEELRPTGGIGVGEEFSKLLIFLLRMLITAVLPDH